MTTAILIWAIGGLIVLFASIGIYKGIEYQKERAIKSGVTLRMRLTIFFTICTVAILLSWITVVCSWVAYLVAPKGSKNLTE